MSILKKNRRKARREQKKYGMWVAPVRRMQEEDLPRRELPENPKGLWDVYHLPFRVLDEFCPLYVVDAHGNTAFDFDDYDEHRLRVRGWGRIQYFDRGEERHDAVREHVEAIMGDAIGTSYHTLEERKALVELLNANWYLTR